MVRSSMRAKWPRLVAVLAVVIAVVLAGGAAAQESRSGSGARSRFAADPGYMLSQALTHAGVRDFVGYSEPAPLQRRPTVQARLLFGKLERAPEVWQTLLNELGAPGTGTWIDQVAFTVSGSSGKWELLKLGISATTDDGP